MQAVHYSIELVSDAAPGTGFGTEQLDELVPRDAEHRPVLSASHLKGLMRDQLLLAARSLEWEEDFLIRIFGGPQEGGADLEAVFHLQDAHLHAEADNPINPVFQVTRTAIDPQSGTALDQSLRTREQIITSSRFRGTLYHHATPDSPEDLAWRFALLAIPAVGGNRTRGAGSCVVRIDDETRSPGDLIRLLDRLLNTPQSSEGHAQPPAARPRVTPSAEVTSNETVLLEVDFIGESPICCPERPTQENMISTGFNIPASAVQGAVLTRINRHNTSLADALFGSPDFRAWPLLPRGLADTESQPDESLPIPVRVSLSHRAAKQSLPASDSPGDTLRFYDEAVRGTPFDWRKAIRGAPLKASDGVLLTSPAASEQSDVQLWRAADMPHVITAHAAHGDPEQRQRALFTIDAMAPLRWHGLLKIPADAADVLQQLVDQEPRFTLGKSRSVRGIGRLKLRPCPCPFHWIESTDAPILIAQSPWLLDDHGDQSAERELFDLVRDWTTRFGLPAPDAKQAWADTGIRFGWNRHKGGPQRARRVLLPGSVIRLSDKPNAQALREAILAAGIGEGRAEGFGAVSVHPGEAADFFRPEPPRQTRLGDPAAAKVKATKAILKLRQQNRGGSLPSRSQIRALQSKLQGAGSSADALQYLNQQIESRPAIWSAWRRVHEEIKNIIETFDAPVADAALDLLAQLQNEKGNRS